MQSTIDCPKHGTQETLPWIPRWGQWICKGCFEEMKKAPFTLPANDFERGFKEGRKTAAEEAYYIARGHAEGDGFEKHGTRQLYWKGRSDAAEEIRKKLLSDDIQDAKITPQQN